MFTATAHGQSARGLARPADFWRDYYMAADQSLPRMKLAELSGHGDHTIRRRVAENRNTPHFVQYFLAADPSVDVRHALALNTAAPRAVLNALTKDPSAVVRLAAATNSALPLPLLIDLADDQHPYVAKRARRAAQRILERRTTRTAEATRLRQTQ